MDRNDLPLGFGFALAQNSDAMQKFSKLPENEQQKLLQQAHAVSSKDEMQRLVNGIAAKA